MDKEKMIKEYAEELRKRDKKDLEHHANSMAAFEIIDNLIEKEINKKKNKKLRSELEIIRSKLDCECGGAIMCYRHYDKKLKSDDYEKIARDRVEVFLARTSED